MLVEKLPLVSVAIITYNQRDFIAECIESVLEQDYAHIEIIISDDCSTDGTQEIIKNYEKKFPEKIFPIYGKKNVGITNNSNIVLSNCKGKYISWLGGDDLMLPFKIEKQVFFLENKPNHVICYHNLEVFDSTTDKVLYLYNSSNIYDHRLFPYTGGAGEIVQHGGFLGACSVMTKKSACPVDGFDTRIPIISDWLFWIETAANGEIGYIDEILGKYRLHENNITKKRADFSEEFISLAIIESKYPEFIDYVKKGRGRIMYYEGKRRLGVGDKKGARHYFREAISSGGMQFVLEDAKQIRS